MHDLRKMTLEQIRYEFRLPDVPVWERAIVDELIRRVRAANAKIRDAHSRPGFDCPCEYCSEVRHG
jgi:hypothetical protein